MKKIEAFSVFLPLVLAASVLGLFQSTAPSIEASPDLEDSKNARFAGLNLISRAIPKNRPHSSPQRPGDTSTSDADQRRSVPSNPGTPTTIRFLARGEQNKTNAPVEAEWIEKPEASNRSAPTFLFISSERKVNELIDARLEKNTSDAESQNGENEYTSEELKKMTPLPTDAIQIKQFSPGSLDDRKTIIRIPKFFDMMAAILKIDFPLEQISSTDTETIKRIKTKVLTLGHGGKLTIAVEPGGLIANGPGPDFVIFENVFEYLNGGGRPEYFQEFAKVGVAAGSGSEVRWFPCDPRAAVLEGCAGAVPTSKGGDSFDLSKVGVKTIREIHIEDLGFNHNEGGDQNEGSDLDGIQLLHGFQES